MWIIRQWFFVPLMMPHVRSVRIDSNKTTLAFFTLKISLTVGFIWTTISRDSRSCSQWSGRIVFAKRRIRRTWTLFLTVCYTATVFSGYMVIQMPWNIINFRLTLEIIWYIRLHCFCLKFYIYVTKSNKKLTCSSAGKITIFTFKWFFCWMYNHMLSKA